jgi:hypothetical protein
LLGQQQNSGKFKLKRNDRTKVTTHNSLPVGLEKMATKFASESL